MKFVCISDIHNRQGQFDLPEGDVLLISGDLTMRGTSDELMSFNSWLGTLTQFKHKIVIAGNHDWLFQNNPNYAKEIMTNCTYLQDSGTTVFLENGEAVNIWGSPWQPEFFNWAFNLPRGEKLAEKWAKIPDDTHILLTHGPAFEHLDQLASGMRVGCDDLKKRIDVLPVLKAHIFGHIHHSYGATQTRSGLMYINASTCNEGYLPENKPIVFKLEDINQDPYKVSY